MKKISIAFVVKPLADTFFVIEFYTAEISWKLTHRVWLVDQVA
jgi:hypothetical protein